jgi:hypothetical protein
MKIILSKNMDDNNLREELAKLEHEQWELWSKDIAEQENISKERLDRWKKCWKKYDKLNEDAKEDDRKWADKVLNIINKYKGEK